MFGISSKLSSISQYILIYHLMMLQTPVIELLTNTDKYEYMNKNETYIIFGLEEIFVPVSNPVEG